jgi:ornithine cyclodeaminase
VIVVSESEVQDRLTRQLAFDAVTLALIAAADGSGTVHPVLMVIGLHECEVFGVKVGSARRERIVGLKVGSYWPGNRTKGIECHGSSILLLDPDTGRLKAVIEASELNGPRTAAADAVAAASLALPRARTLTLIGAGNQAAFEARAICAIRPITRILVVSRDSVRAAKLCDRLSHELNINVEVADVEPGCRQADIVVTVTPSRKPLFDARWIRAGTHIASMGSDQAGKQELPTDLLHRAHLFCDLPSQSLAIGEFQHLRAEISSGELSVTAIGDVLRGQAPGRLTEDEITVFDSSGISLQDLYIAAMLIEDR